MPFCGNRGLLGYYGVTNRTFDPCRQACFRTGCGYRRYRNFRMSFCGNGCLSSNDFIADRTMRACGFSCRSTSRGYCGVGYNGVSVAPFRGEYLVSRFGCGNLRYFFSACVIPTLECGTLFFSICRKGFRRSVSVRSDSCTAPAVSVKSNFVGVCRVLSLESGLFGYCD